MKVFFTTIFIICAALSVLSIRSLWILKDYNKDPTHSHNGTNVQDAREFCTITLTATTTYCICHASLLLVLYLKGY